MTCLLRRGGRGGRTDRQTTLHKEPKQTKQQTNESFAQRTTQPGTSLRNSSLGI